MRQPLRIQDPTPKSEDEIKILKELNNKYIVKYLTSFREPHGSLWIVMEFCDKGSLSNFIKV